VSAASQACAPSSETGRSRPYVIPLFIPHAGCPHRCIFCNQHSTTAARSSVPSEAQIRQTVDQYLGFRSHRRHSTEIAFFGGNFLGLDAEIIDHLMMAVAPYVDRGAVDGIRFSTRPDTIDTHRLDRITAFPVTTIELGVQSMNDAVLKASHRGHTARQTECAVALLKARPYRIGLQMMLGLPMDTPERAIASGERIAALKPDAVRIYPALVLAESPLERLYRNGSYLPWDLETAVRVSARLVARFEKNGIPVIRMGLQATDALVSAGGVFNALWFNCIEKALEHTTPGPDRLIIEVHPQCISQVRGQRNSNVKRLQQQFNLQHVNVVPNRSLPRNTVQIGGRRWRCVSNRR